MKTINSFGGPFIGLNRNDLTRWSGAFGKSTIGSQSTLSSDYEAACALTGRVNLAFDGAGLLLKLSSEAFLIAPPVETALITCDADTILIAQVEAAAEQWSFADVSKEVVEEAHFSGAHILRMNAPLTEYVLFDSSIDGESADDVLSIIFSEGDYKLESAMYRDGDTASLNLYRFSKTT